MARFPQTGPKSQGSSTASKWWVVFTTLGQSIHPAPNPQGLTSFRVVQAPNSSVASSMVSRQGMVVTSIEGPFDSKPDAERAASGTVSVNKRQAKAAGAQGGKSFPNPVAWFQQATGGILAGALEQGFIQILKDLWGVIVGPLEIIAGVLIAIFVLAIYFRNDIATIAMAAAK